MDEGVKRGQAFLDRVTRERLDKAKKGNGATNWDDEDDFPSVRTESSPPIVALTRDESTPPLESGVAGPLDMPENLPLDAYADEAVPRETTQTFTDTYAKTRWEKPFNTQKPHEFPEKPTDFWQEGQIPEMQHEWMPNAFADYFFHESETRGSDPGIFWGFGCGIAAGATSDAMKVQVKPEDPMWLESARLWIAIGGDSGDMKSPSLTALIRPLNELEQRLMEKAARDIEQFNDDQEAFEALRKRYIQAKVDNKTTERPTPPERPCRNRLIVRNSTLQGLRTVLQDQGERGILEVHDELISVFTGANEFKSKGGSDLQERLKLWDGGPHTFDLSGNLISVKNWSTSIVGGTQPAKIRGIVSKMGLSDDGSIQRFNFYLTRHANLDMERPAHAGHVQFTDVIERLYELQHQGRVHFSEAAHEIRREFFIWTHAQRTKQWLNEAFRSHISKYNNYFARFCMTYHAIESAHEHSAYIKPEISEAIAKQVSALLKDCLYHHASKFYNETLETSHELHQEVKYLAEKLLAKDPKTIDVRWITQGWNKWRTFKPWQKKGILTTLQEQGWIQSSDPRGYIDGQPYRAQVNPHLQLCFAEYVPVARARLEELAERRERNMLGD